MNISSDDLPAIITASAAGIATLATVITNLVMTFRQRKQIADVKATQTVHGADIAELRSSTGTGTHKALGSGP